MYTNDQEDKQMAEENLGNATFDLIKLHYPIKGVRTNTSEFTPLKNISLGYKVDDKGEATLVINKDPFYEAIVLSNFESFSEVCLVVYRQLNLLSTEATPDFIQQLQEVVQQQLSGLLFVQQQYDMAKKLLGLDD
jgi:uncharacterized lipoprotein YajG